MSVDKEVVQKAKKLGINISDITEKVLKGYTSAEKPNGSLYDGYRLLFDSIVPLLKEFSVDVKIAEQTVTGEIDGNEITIGTNDIFLESDGSFWSSLFEASLKDIEKISMRDFLSPKEILANLVDALVKSKEAREKQMKEILMAKRIIEAMTEGLTKPRRKLEKEKRPKNPTTKTHSKEKGY